MEKSTRNLHLLFFTLICFSSAAQLSLESSYAIPVSSNELSVEDITAPRTDLLRTEAGDFVYGPATRLKFKIIEEESGLETTYFKVSDLPYMKSDGRQMMPDQLEDGVYRMLYYSVDKSGNQEQIRSDMIHIDRKGPNVTTSFNNAPTNFIDGMPVFPSGVQLLIEVADEHVEVQKVTYQINNQPKVNSAELGFIDLTQELTKISDEKITIEVTAYDYFYNITKETIEFKISR
jgi:hypothetical protein